MKVLKMLTVLIGYLMVLFFNTTEMQAQKNKVPKWFRGQWTGEVIQIDTNGNTLEYRVSALCDKDGCIVEYVNDNITCGAQWLLSKKEGKRLVFTEDGMGKNCMGGLEILVEKVGREAIYYSLEDFMESDKLCISTSDLKRPVEVEFEF